MLGIIRTHKGAIIIKSRGGRGTSVKTLLPLKVREKALKPAAEAAAGRIRKKEGAGEKAAVPRKILIVEDDECVRRLCKSMVEFLKFSTATARGGREALEIFSRNPDDFICVLLDWGLPGMNGIDILKELRRIRPDVKVILSTGYSEEEAKSQFKDFGLSGIIEKPYQLQSLKKMMDSIV